MATEEKVPPSYLVLLSKGLSQKVGVEEERLEGSVVAPFSKALDYGRSQEVRSLVLQHPLL